MRSLLLTRGCPGAGKSTWIKSLNLEPYTLSPDSIRVMLQSPVMTTSGGYAISQDNDKEVWAFLFKVLEERMKRGEFTIIDATNTKTRDIDRFKDLCEFYRYRCFIVDFTDVPIEIAKLRNKSRESYKFVPENVIENMYARFETQKVPKWAKVIKPDEVKELFQFSTLDFNSWKKIHHIGDLHGCYTVLMEYLNSQGGMKDDELYIFVGDFVDRGIENAALVRFMASIAEKPNVILIEGNHDVYLWQWAHGTMTRSKMFENKTKPELESKGVNKSDARKIYRKVRVMAYYTYGNKTVLVTHGGISAIPENFMLLAAKELINGVGEYSTPIDQHFMENTKGEIYQIHGHRNVQDFPIQVTERCFNLEGGVEFGGHLRVVTLSPEGFTTYEILNTVHNRGPAIASVTKKETELAEAAVTAGLQEPTTNAELLEQLRSNPGINETKYKHISSFNFKRDVFLDKNWDAQTIKARGLFLNNQTGEIIARSYNKFFNIGEIQETKLPVLSQTMQFPAVAYLKENGYLGIVGYDSTTDELVFTSKSMVTNDFAQRFKDIFFSTVMSVKDQEEIKKQLREYGWSLVFEVIDPKFDPHIIKYDERHIVLLDIVKRSIEYKKEEYATVCDFASKFGFKCKKFVREFRDWGEFLAWHDEVMDNKNDLRVEGYVIEDSAGFMTKLKLPYYQFWKHMRFIKDTIVQKRSVPTGSLLTPLANEFHAWLLSLPNSLRRRDIIYLRDKFYYEKDTGVKCRPCPGFNYYADCIYYNSRDNKCSFLTDRECKRTQCCGTCTINCKKEDTAN